MQRFKKHARLLTEQLGGSIEYGHDGSLTVRIKSRSASFTPTSVADMTCVCSWDDESFTFTTRKHYIFDIIDRLATDHLFTTLRGYGSPVLLELSDYITEERGEPFLQSLRDQIAADPTLQYAELGGNCILVEYVRGALIIRDDLCRAATNVVDL